MSAGWDAYITNMSTAGAVDSGIYTKEGATCAQSTGMQLSPEEVKTFNQAVSGNLSGDTKFTINGNPCALINYDKDEGWFQCKTKQPVKVGDESTKVFYYGEATQTFFVLAGKTGAGERQACKISHDMAVYLKGLGM